jgi:3-hydroxymyristoyl/3-hydroxydecanoyl-(acyl carrier protein) dehydratase
MAPLTPVSDKTRMPGAKTVTLPIGGPILSGRLPAGVQPVRPDHHDIAAAALPVRPEHGDLDFFGQTLRSFEDNIVLTAQAHSRYLDLSQTMARSFAEALEFQSDLIAQAVAAGDPLLMDALVIDRPFACDPATVPATRSLPRSPSPATPMAQPSPAPVFKPAVAPRPEPAFSREMCMEFAIGSIGKMLGPMFDVVDTYKVRVRLPDEPLMLVDRIMSVDGEKGSLKSGTVVTEHDVLPGAWYLDGGRCPVCISIEAGQADLFLCSYLGIDLAVKGKRSYRLLDAVAEFHSGLPRPGDTIRYVIDIDRFINQGETYLFFFRFNGYIGDRHVISMRNGCAGFFTEKEVKDSGGIILTAEETAHIPGKIASDFKELIPFFNTGETWHLTDDQVDALRQGDAEGAFGPVFKNKRISPSMVIPGGRMKLVDRVLEIDPAGGRYGLGSIRAQADIHPDDWFLTCHFVDDMVMPGTLMYECCMHTLRIFTMRMGWITDLTDVVCEPIPNVKSVLKCRGPVTVATKHVFYKVDIKEIGYNPEPYVLADAHMYAHDQHIVMFRDMSMKLSGVTRGDIERYWGIV